MTQASTIILTRPATDSESWLNGLKAHGYEVHNWPLIEINSTNPSHPFLIKQEDLHLYKALVFVSPSAVEFFFKKLGLTNPNLRPALVSNMPCWATGQGTAQALKRSGVAAEHILSPPPDSAQFDSPHLWALAKTRVTKGDMVLFIKGIDHAEQQAVSKTSSVCIDLPSHEQPTGSNWLAHQLELMGVVVQNALVYERMTVRWDPQQIEKAIQALTASAVWVFTSSLTVVRLGELLRGCDFSRARAVVTHPRIAEHVHALGFGVVCSSRPTLQDILLSLKSIVIVS